MDSRQRPIAFIWLFTVNNSGIGLQTKLKVNYKKQQRCLVLDIMILETTATECQEMCVLDRVRSFARQRMYVAALG
jgi:hypothetical protein